MNIPHNPFISSIFTADPSARSWDGETLYVYASHDIYPARGCDLMDRYHVFSTKDMVNWTDEGEILSSEDVKWGRPEGGFMWAPDCAYRNGLYYFYYPHPSETAWNDSWKIGVAVSKYPNRDFTDQGYIKGLGGFALIDPCVLVDDDGQAYIYIGGGARAFGAKLNDDMVSLKTEPVPMEGLYDFHEATWVFKRNGLYYLSYSDNTQPGNYMRYAVSKNPLGPWTYKSAYMPPVGCETTHGSVTEFKGQWYQFYHNQKISGQGNLRSICVDKLFFDGNGDILPMELTSEVETGLGVPDGAVTLYTGEFNLHDGTDLTVSTADGGNGGRATLWVDYTTCEHWAKLRLTVNGKDESFINALDTGGDEAGLAGLTVRLNPGKDNKITLTCGEGEVKVRSVSVSYL